MHFFRSYHIDEDCRLAEKKLPETLEDLCGRDKFRPAEDVVDRRILYEITGRKQDDDDLISSTDEDEQGSGSFSPRRPIPALRRQDSNNTRSPPRERKRESLL